MLRRPSPLLALAALVVSGVAAGCGAAEDKTREAGGWSDNDPNAPKLGNEAAALRDMSALSEAPSLFGVRHDVELKRDRGGLTSCSCIVAHAGDAADGRFAWQGEVPSSRGDAIVVAISAADVACDALPDGTKRRASISAVDESDGNVYVEVEELPPGRPLALGAIVPKPRTGHVYLRPKNKKTPFARTTTGACRIQ